MFTLPENHPKSSPVEADLDCAAVVNWSCATDFCGLPTSQPAPGASKFGIRELSVGRSYYAVGTGRKKPTVQTGEAFGRPVVGLKSQDQLGSRADESPSSIDQRLHHRLQALAFGCMSYRRVRPEQTALADQAQDVHRNRRGLAHQVVGVELARRQSGQVQYGLELGVKLLMRAVVSVQRHDVGAIELVSRQARRPAGELDLRGDRNLTSGVDSALNEPQHAPHRPSDAGHWHQLFPHRQALALSRLIPPGAGVAGQVCSQRLARASMRWRSVGLDGSKPMPRACLKNASPRKFSTASKSLLPCVSRPRYARAMSLLATHPWPASPHPSA